MTDRGPNFFVIGAGRCGTTSIHRFLSQHPDAFVPVRKSPNYYASHIAQPEWETSVARQMASHWMADPREYEALFAAAGQARAVGDVSPVYLQATDVARAIHADHPQARLIAILRDPAQRAYAHFLGRRRDGIEPAEDFHEWVVRVLRQPLPDDVAFGHYVACGRYHHFLTPYADLFGAGRILVLFYEDLINDAAGVMRSVFEFLGIDPDFVPNLDVRMNVSGEIVNPVKRMLWTSSVRLRTAARPLLPRRMRDAVGSVFLSDMRRPVLRPDTRRLVVEALRSDIDLLEEMTDRDLNGWRT